jgi:hypothetical protein
MIPFGNEFSTVRNRSKSIIDIFYEELCFWVISGEIGSMTVKPMCSAPSAESIL